MAHLREVCIDKGGPHWRSLGNVAGVCVGGGEAGSMSGALHGAIGDSLCTCGTASNGGCRPCCRATDIDGPLH